MVIFTHAGEQVFKNQLRLSIKVRGGFVFKGHPTPAVFRVGPWLGSGITPNGFQGLSGEPN